MVVLYGGMSDLLTVPEIAVRLRVCRETVRRYLRDGRLDGVRIGRAWLVSSESLARLLTSVPTAPTL